MKITPSKNAPNMDSGDMLRHSGLEKHQRVLSVAFLVWPLSSLSRGGICIHSH